LPPGDEHYYNEDILSKEEEEFRLADGLLCPSSFVEKTFLDQGFAREKLLRHTYGFDQQRFRPANTPLDQKKGLTMLFAGVCSVVKGLHFALEAWLRSPAHTRGTFLIAGKFLPAYAERLASMLADPSVKVLGPRDDVPDLMRGSHVLVLPSLTEGFPLVLAEAMGSGCAVLVSDACPDLYRHMENALVHRVGDTNSLAEHISMLNENPALLERLRASSLRTARELTWKTAGVKLLNVYSAFLNKPNSKRST
jgi:glycosyltransferase involved in cell wall biosynthesis